MRLVSLSSGSCGNAIYIEAGRTKILVDAGTTVRYLGKHLQAIGVALDDLDAVLITHEHSDHIRSAAAVSRLHGAMVLANEETLDALPLDFQKAKVRVFPMGERFAVGDLEVEAVPQSHDCRSPVGFALFHGGKKICVATDLGRVTAPVAKALAGADVIVLESNHDFKMLAHGRYPPRLKARIAGDRGHLSNIAAGRTLSELASGREQKVLLAHLSQDNNHPDVAVKTVKEILAQKAIDSIKVSVAARLVPSLVVNA